MSSKKLTVDITFENPLLEQKVGEALQSLVDHVSEEDLIFIGEIVKKPGIIKKVKQFSHLI